MRDRLIGLCDRKIEEMHFVNSDHWFDFSQKINEIVDYLIANGVVVIDTDVVSPKNRPLISQYMGRPIDEVINLIRRSEWISVEERLPDENGYYLVYTKYGYIEVERYKMWDDNDLDGGYWWEFEGLVTHWMPLPEPPKMKGGG